MEKLAIILTCFNRKEKTEQCLKAIIQQQHIYHDKLEFYVYITDDGSSDGTSDMLKKYSNRINMSISIGHDLYWNKGMNLALKHAVMISHDYYLMVNDDVDFNTDFLEVMFESYKLVGKSCGVSGATQDKRKITTSYGGKKFRSKEFVNPNGTIQEIDLANWNCFLIDQEVIDKVGINDPNYEHSYGDYDYSMSMRRKGLGIFLATKYIGTCNRNTITGTFKDKRLSRRQRIKIFFSPKGMSIKSGIRYGIKNFDFLGSHGLMMFLGAYFKNLIMVLLG